MSLQNSEKAEKWVKIVHRARSEGVTTPWWEELKKYAGEIVVPPRI